MEIKCLCCGKSIVFHCNKPIGINGVIEYRCNECSILESETKILAKFLFDRINENHIWPEKAGWKHPIKQLYYRKAKAALEVSGNEPSIVYTVIAAVTNHYT